MTDTANVFPNISGYRIERKLGEGGMASVYLAVQEGFERRVALKVLSPNLGTEDEDYKKRFVREARTAAQMSHQSIVPIYDFGVCDDLHYMAMEYLPGGDLKQRMLTGISVNEAISIAKAIAKALDYAGQKGLVHRDIKPENILFREDNSPVISDFGIARQICAETNINQIGNIVGTPRYMSPEQAQGNNIDSRSDLYSLGIIFYELLAGKAPFITDAATSVSIKHITEMPPPLPPELACLQPIVDIALEKNPDTRFQTGKDFVKALTMVEDRLPATCRNTLVLNTSDAINTSLARVGTNPSTITSYAQKTIPERALRSERRQAQNRSYYHKPWFWLAGFVVTQLVLGGVWLTFQTNDREHADAATVEFQTQAVLDQGNTPQDSSDAESPVDTTELITAEHNALNYPNIDPAQTPVDEIPGAQQNSDLQPDQQSGAIMQLLDSAHLALQQNRLTKPETDNAQYYFEQVLALVPDNAEALTGLNKIRQQFLAKINHALAAKQFDKAESLLSAYASIAQPAEFKSLQQRLIQNKTETAKSHAAKTKLEALLADVKRLKSQPRDQATNTLLRDRYRDILASDPTHTEARQGLKDVAQFEVQLAEQAIAEHRLENSEQQLQVLRNTAPDVDLSLLQSKLQQARVNAEKISVLLSQARALIAQPYVKPGWLETNREARDRLIQAYTLIDDARKLNRKDYRLDEALNHLDEKYAAIVSSLLHDKNKSAADEFVSDTRQYDWRGTKLTLANTGITGATMNEVSATENPIQLAQSTLLADAQRLIETPYIKPGLLESNREPRTRLTLAYQKLDDARKLVPDDPRVTALIAQLDTKYATIVQLLITDGEPEEARAFIDDTRNFKWQSPMLTAVDVPE